MIDEGVLIGRPGGTEKIELEILGGFANRSGENELRRGFLRCHQSNSIWSRLQDIASSLCESVEKTYNKVDNIPNSFFSRDNFRVTQNLKGKWPDIRL
jgi:hypothetical protein